MKVIIFNPYLAWDFHLNLEAAIYHNLVGRGYKVQYINCGIESPACDLRWRNLYPNESERRLSCRSCRLNSAKLLSDRGIEECQLNQFLKPEDGKVAESIAKGCNSESFKEVCFAEVNLFSAVISSVYTDLRVNKFDYNNEIHRRCLLEYYNYAVLVIISLKRLFEQSGPDLIVTFNGRMAPTNIARIIGQRLNIPVVSHERGFSKGTFQIFKNADCTDTKKYQELGEKLTVPLTEGEVRRVEEWLETRFTGGPLSWKSFVDERSEAPKLEISTGFNSIWTLFTSSTDELAAHPQFSGPLEQSDWINETIRFVNLQNSIGSRIKLVIRFHPNSGGGKGSTGNNLDELALCSNLMRTPSENVSVIPPDSDIDSYRLMIDSDLILTYASTISLEAAAVGKRVIAAGRGIFSTCRAIQSVESREDYFKLLQRATHPASNEETNEALQSTFRFLSSIVEHHEIHPQVVHQVSPSTNTLLSKNVSDYYPGGWASLDKLVDQIISENHHSPSSEIKKSTASLQTERSAIEKSVILLSSRIRRDKPNTRPFLSVIIPNYNYGRYLLKCIQSIEDQSTSENIEVIIVDDGSTDDSHTILKTLNFEKLRHNYRLIFQSNSGQPAIPRNNGIKEAEGKFILPLDPDDTIHPEYIEKIKRYSERYPEVDVITSDWLLKRGDHAHLVKIESFALRDLVVANRLPISSAFKKSSWMKVGGYRENVRGYEDWDLWIALSAAGCVFGVCDGPGLIYNDKVDGLAARTQGNHNLLYANIIANNPNAFRHLRNA